MVIPSKKRSASAGNENSKRPKKESGTVSAKLKILLKDNFFQKCGTIFVAQDFINYAYKPKTFRAVNDNLPKDVQRKYLLSQDEISSMSILPTINDNANDPANVDYPAWCMVPVPKEKKD